LHAALKEHALLRSEELEYERAQQSTSMLTGMKLLFGGSVVSGLAFANLLQRADMSGAVTYGVVDSSSRSRRSPSPACR